MIDSFSRPDNIIMSRPQPPSVSSVHHPRDLPLPLDARDHVINALLMNSTIQTLEKRLLETGEATGWLDALRKHALELVRSRRDVTCKEVVDQLTKEAWKGSRKMVHDLGENGTRADGFRVNVNVERMNGNGERVYDRQFFDNFDRYEQWGECSTYHHQTLLRKILRARWNISHTQ